MEQHRKTAMHEVTSTFAQWKTVHDRLNALNKELDWRDALSAERCADLELEQRALQLESDRLLLAASHALLKIKTPRSSSGDSTWG